MEPRSSVIQEPMSISEPRPPLTEMRNDIDGGGISVDRRDQKEGEIRQSQQQEEPEKTASLPLAEGNPGRACADTHKTQTLGEVFQVWTRSRLNPIRRRSGARDLAARELRSF